MNILKEYLEQLVEREVGKALQGKLAPEAPKGAEFGQIAFAPTRKDVPAPKEPNTPQEQETQKAIATYLTTNNKAALNAKAPLLLKLHQQGYYKKILDPGEFSSAYRFLRMDREVFASIVGLDAARLPVFGTTNPGSLKPKDGQVSGWTVSPALFIKGGFDGYGDGDIVAIFKASIGNNKFFGNPRELAKAVGEPKYKDEMEILAVGPVAYEKCSFAVLQEDEMFGDDELLRIKLQRVLRNLGG